MKKKIFSLIILTILVSCEKEIEITEAIDTPKYVCITVDDAPNFPVNTTKMLDVLDKYEVEATFFCIGEILLKEKKLANRISKEHVMANHTYTHRDMGDLDYLFADQYMYLLKNEVYNTQAIIDSINTINNRKLNNYFRPPYGSLYKKGIEGISNTHEIIMWDISAEDWNPDISVNYIFSFIINEINTYEIPIILFHLSENSPISLDKVLNYFKENKIEVISLKKRKDLLDEER